MPPRPKPSLSPAERSFTWRDGDRLIRFGRGTVDEAAELATGAYALLTTARALALAPRALVDRAADITLVGSGPVDELAAALRGQPRPRTLVALGGGRIIDVAKALAAADPPKRVIAIPTTLSGAEMTAIHRHARGVAPTAAKVRPEVVICDPGLSASQPARELAASASNALAHAIEASATRRASPLPTLAAQEAASLIAAAYSGEQVDRDGLALAALLAGYALDGAGYGLHHVVAQTLVRYAGLGHGQANAVMLPHTIAALRLRAPDALNRLEEYIGTDPAILAALLARRASAVSLRRLRVRRADLREIALRAAERPELELTPPRPTAAELEAIYGAAWSAGRAVHA